MMIDNFDEIMSILSKSLREYSRRITGEIIDLIVDLIKSCILHVKENPSQILEWLSSQFFDYYTNDNKRHRENLFEVFTKILLGTGYETI